MPCKAGSNHPISYTAKHALQKIIRSNRNRLEIEMSELLLDIKVAMDVDSVSFCLNDLVVDVYKRQV